jgi:hypothetical protein
MTKLTRDQKRKKKLKVRKEKSIAKQKTNVNNNSTVDVVTFTPELLGLFNQLSPLNEEFEFVPQVRQFCELQNKLFERYVDDIEYAVASTVVMYGHWYTSGSTIIAVSDLIEASAFIIEHPKFLHQFREVAA